MYIYHNKINDQLIAFSNLKAIAVNTGINKNTLDYQFIRKKREFYERPEFRIIRTELIKSKRKPG
jgi:hypothetical protein